MSFFMLQALNKEKASKKKEKKKVILTVLNHVSWECMTHRQDKSQSQVNPPSQTQSTKL